MPGGRFRIALLASAVAMVWLAASATTAGGGAAPDPAEVGRFGAPFEDIRPSEGPDKCLIDADGRKFCKPAGATLVLLDNGKVLYWDALEGTENVQLTLIAEFSRESRNSRTRVLDLAGPEPVFSTPTPEDGGANPDGNDNETLPGIPNSTGNDTVNDGDLFCSDQVQLADGRILAVGGTDYYAEPAIPGTDAGLVELEGLKNGRIFDPDSQTWTQTGSMNYGRWYPSLVTLPDGKVLVTSGVTKLIKPLYPDRPFDSGTNVKQLEVYDPATGQWTQLPDSANRSLPLFPRIHLLPNGHVYYDVGGQSFNPMGQSYDMAFWNIAATFDPATNQWHDLGIPGLGLGLEVPDIPGLSNGDLGGIPILDGVPLDGLPLDTGALDPSGFGFRGSTFSIMLPLTPDANGQYSSASFLTAGGTASALLPSPGTYLGQAFSRINTVNIDPATGTESLSSAVTGPMNTPRWYGTGVLLPTGEVMAFSGANVDEVATPSVGQPVRTAELFDPETGGWRPMATATQPRTYHNTALLLPDGRVLVGGHAPISTLYLFNTTLPVVGEPNPDRDPSFEIYEPPYLFRGDRPEITGAPASVGYGGTIEIQTPDAANLESVVLMRNTALTHLVDGDQRSVVLPIVERRPGSVLVQAPPDGAVAPAGPYLLFANERIDGELVPSVAAQVSVDGSAVNTATVTPPPTLPPTTAAPAVIPSVIGQVKQLVGRLFG